MTTSYVQYNFFLQTWLICFEEEMLFYSSVCSEKTETNMSDYESELQVRYIITCIDYYKKQIIIIIIIIKML